MSEWFIKFRGFCQVDAPTREEAIKILRSLNPHDGRVYDDQLTITKVECMDDQEMAEDIWNG
jgi:hypothetical protein